MDAQGIINELLKEHPEGMYLQWYETGDLTLCIEHYRYTDPRQAPKLWLGKYKKPNLHQSKPNCFYIYGTNI